jgi:hypothetical protein
MCLLPDYSLSPDVYSITVHNLNLEIFINLNTKIPLLIMKILKHTDDDVLLFSFYDT